VTMILHHSFSFTNRGKEYGGYGYGYNVRDLYSSAPRFLLFLLAKWKLSSCADRGIGVTTGDESNLYLQQV